MAFVYQKSLITLTFLDTSGEKVTRTYETRYSDLAYVATIADNVANGMSQLSSAAIIKREVTAIYADTAAVVPPASSNKDVLVVSDMIRGMPTERGYFSIPAPRASLFVSPTGEGHNIMKWPYPPMDGWVKYFMHPDDGGYGHLFLSDGEQLSGDDVSGRRGHRSRR